MKRLMLSVMVVAVAVAFTGCKKKETAGTRLDKAVDQSEKASQDAAKEGDQAAGDLQKKLDGALKK